MFGGSVLARGNCCGEMSRGESPGEITEINDRNMYFNQTKDLNSSEKYALFVINTRCCNFTWVASAFDVTR